MMSILYYSYIVWSFESMFYQNKFDLTIYDSLYYHERKVTLNCFQNESSGINLNVEVPVWQLIFYMENYVLLSKK